MNGDKMPMRRSLPARRRNETLKVQAGGMDMLMTVGFFEDGAPAEVFVSGVKSGSDFDATARDGAVLLSLALQHGVPLQTVAHAVTRNPDGSAGGVLGALVDILLKGDS